MVLKYQIKKLNFQRPLNLKLFIEIVLSSLRNEHCLVGGSYCFLISAAKPDDKEKKKCFSKFHVPLQKNYSIHKTKT